MFVCPSILDTVSMGTPFDSVVVVANVCRAVWNKIGKQSTGNEKKGQRNPLETNHFSIFFHLLKKQESGDY